jgi:hypothetical protein
LRIPELPLASFESITQLFEVMMVFDFFDFFDFWKKWMIHFEHFLCFLLHDHFHQMMTRQLIHVQFGLQISLLVCELQENG